MLPPDWPRAVLHPQMHQAGLDGALHSPRQCRVKCPELRSPAGRLNSDLNPESSSGDVGPAVPYIFPKHKLLRDEVTSWLLVLKGGGGGAGWSEALHRAAAVPCATQPADIPPTKSLIQKWLFSPSLVCPALCTCNLGK